MAEGKKSFVLYSDQRGVFDKLSDEQAGILIKHIFGYVNDEKPKGDFITELAFESIKQQLKRDLVKYEVRADRSRANGKLGGRPKNPEEPKKPNGLINNPDEPRKPDTVNGIDIDNDNEKVIKDWIGFNCNGFSDELKQWISILETKYDNQTSIIQLESFLRLLNGWYKNNYQKAECLNKHISSNWKTLNFVDIKINKDKNLFK